MKKTFFIILFLIIAIFSEAQVNFNHYMRVGRTRIAIGNYTGAIEYFNIVIKFRPYLPEPYYFRGVAKHQLEDFRGALLDYNKAIEIKPFYPEAYVHRGLAHHNLKEYEEAIKDYNTALELDPENEAVFNNRGIAKISLKDLDGAFADYNKALELNPQSTTALMNRSNAYIIKGDTRSAIADLNNIIIIRPHYAGAYLNRGLARFEMKDYASALRDYDQCINLDPKNSLAYNNRGIVKHQLEDYQGAIMDYDMALALDPELANAYFNRAMAKEILGRPGFESDYSLAAQLNPQYDLSRFQVDAGQLAQNTQGSQQGQQQNQGSQPGSNQQNTSGSAGSSQNNSSANTQNDNNDEAKEHNQRRRKPNLIIADSRDIPSDEEEEEVEDDGYVQNKNIIIDLQPVFIISAFDKNLINYDHLQYYNNVVESMNNENNYNPLLTITNKTNISNQDVFRNFILFFNEKIEINPNSHNYTNRGIFKTLTHEYNSSITDLNRAIELDPGNILALFTRGNSRYKMIEFVESLPDANNQPVGLSSSFSDYQTKDDPVIINEDYKQILEDYEKVINLNPRFFFAFFNRANINLRLENYENAIEDLDKAIELEPSFAEAYYNRGLTKIFLDDVDGGALDLSKAGELGLVSAYNVIKRYCN